MLAQSSCQSVSQSTHTWFISDWQCVPGRRDSEILFQIHSSPRWLTDSLTDCWGETRLWPMTHVDFSEFQRSLRRYQTRANKKIIGSNQFLVLRTLQTTLLWQNSHIWITRLSLANFRKISLWRKVSFYKLSNWDLVLSLLLLSSIPLGIRSQIFVFACK